ncbi:SMP-30/gluconolactonase/LRE family protein [Gordonia sp. HY285]|uniref:SMP-30/gluconolactonase/LRE family protein n=1 Tax=Gordonia liuliyuniae TaxID=2911517 RepID=UPI001F42FC8B|nr:SMP-30/gluconolactonase/LRE family protein [Gordonia liuliyuniae]MCF8608923.1 SMP-30/gluconolactonase/LRE family protein [Gordonia liuliyuniae]
MDRRLSLHTHPESVAHNAVTGSTVLLQAKSGLARDVSLSYWREQLSQTAARRGGVREYRQHHLSDAHVTSWPDLGDAVPVPSDCRIDGIEEFVFDRVISGVRRYLSGQPPHGPGAGLFEWTCEYPSGTEAGRRFTPPATEGTRTGARTVALFHRCQGVDSMAIDRLLNEVLGPTLARLSGITEVRTQPFRHRRSPDRGLTYDGALILGATDRVTLTSAIEGLCAGRPGNEIQSVCSAVHAYAVERTYVFAQEGRTTLPQTGPVRKPPLDPVRRRIPRGPRVPTPTQTLPEAVFIPLPDSPRLARPGPEDVVVGADGYLYCSMGDGSIVRVDPDSGVSTVVDRTGGRPLGLEPLPDGRLLVCDTQRGLRRLDPATSECENLVQYVDDIPLRFCSNATTASDGAIWFTESTTRFDIEHFMGSLLEHRGSGRLLRFDPDGTIDVVLDGLRFPNGVATSPDGSFLVLAETSGYQLSRVETTGPRAGARRSLSSDMPGIPDNISTFRDGRAWVAMTGPREPALDRLASVPGSIRELLWRLPRIPSERSYVWARSMTSDGAVVDDVHGVVEGFHHATGIAEFGGALYLAGPHQSRLLRLEIER